MDDVLRKPELSLTDIAAAEATGDICGINIGNVCADATKALCLIKIFLRRFFKMKDSNCGYCMRGELLDAFGIYICDLSVSSLILFKEQSHPGRCIVAYKDHVSELVDISDADRDAFFADVARASKAIHAAFHPDKVNYGAYGDGGCHLHFPLVPKYKEQFEWGGVFQMNPGQVKLSDEEYAEMIEKIKSNL